MLPVPVLRVKLGAVQTETRQIEIRTVERDTDIITHSIIHPVVERVTIQEPDTILTQDIIRMLRILEQSTHRHVFSQNYPDDTQYTSGHGYSYRTGVRRPNVRQTTIYLRNRGVMSNDLVCWFHL